MGAKLYRRRVCALLTVALLTVLPSVAVPRAAAEPGLLADSPTLNLTALGSNSTIAFYGQEGVETVTIPVPQGLMPDALTATVEMPVFVQGGSVVVSQDGRTISRVDLPPDNVAPIVLPLAGVAVVDNAVTLMIRTYLGTQQGYCLDPTNPLRLVDTAVTYVGIEAAPTAVADFLPPVLTKLTLFLPDAPTRAESDAAVRLATAVVARYGTATTDVVVAELVDGHAVPLDPSLPFERRIVIREQDEAGVALDAGGGVPPLMITGPAGELANQVRLISSDLSRIALSSKAVVGPLRSAPQLPGNLTTIRNLGQPGVNATALSPQVVIGLDQTRLGRAAHNVRVHLVGSHTPVPQSVGGQVVVSIGGENIDRWPVESTGTIDRWVSVPDDQLQRYTNLAVTVDISGDVGGCGEFQPITLTIDGSTAVESEASTPPTPGGFGSLPQALMPRVEVGIDGDSLADTARAVAVLSGMQRLSALPLDTAVTGISDALASSNPAVLIASTGWNHPDVELPLASVGAGELEVAAVEGETDRTTLTLVPNLRYASLQAMFDGTRSLLVATSTDAPELLDRLLTYLDADGSARRWARLSGDVVVAAQDRDPVVLDTTPDMAAEPEDQQSDSTTHLWLGGAVIALVLLGSGLVVVKARSRT